MITFRRGGLAIDRTLHLGELGLDLPRGRLRGAQAPSELDRGDALLGLRDQVHGPEPRGQRRLGRVEDRARRHRCLTPARIALVELARSDDAMSAAAALWAHETVGPAPRRHQRAASILIAVERLEPSVREPLLKLDAIACHGQPLRSARE